MDLATQKIIKSFSFVDISQLNIPVSLIIIGIIISVAIIINIVNINDIFIELMLPFAVFGSVGSSFTGSSFIESEKYIWFYLLATVYFVLFIKG